MCYSNAGCETQGFDLQEWKVRSTSAVSSPAFLLRVCISVFSLFCVCVFFICFWLVGWFLRQVFSTAFKKPID